MGKTNPKLGVTVAMPSFNSAATLELSICSLLNQSYGDFELLLCDDDSDDQGLAITHSFNDPRVICWKDARRLGLAARLNECIDRARVCTQLRPGAWPILRLLVIPAARFVANCFLALVITKFSKSESNSRSRKLGNRA